MDAVILRGHEPVACEFPAQAEDQFLGEKAVARQTGQGRSVPAVPVIDIGEEGIIAQERRPAWREAVLGLEE
jgi:hypothetical protein